MLNNFRPSCTAMPAGCCLGHDALKTKIESMPVNSTHPDYDGQLDSWGRIRDVLEGDATIKARGEKYLARLDSQSDEEFRAYVDRGFFYNATARTVSGYIGLSFRRDPVLLLPEASGGAEGCGQ